MRRSARPGLLRWQLAGRPLIRRGKKGLRAALAAEAATEVGRLAAAAAADLAGGGSLEAVELALRAGLTQLGGGLLEGLLAADAGHRGPAVECGTGHRARFVSYRDKAVDTVLGPVTVRRAWYHCPQCGHGLAPRDAELGVAGQVMSPGLRKMAARAAAAVPFAKAAALVGELAGITLTGKRAGRSAEADGAAAAQLVQAEAAAIAARALVPMPPPAPAPDKLYIAIDGTGVPMVAAETAGRDGKGDDGKARTREVKLCAVFTQATIDEEGRPVRDPGSSSYLATFAPASEFGVLMAAEARRRGAGHIRQLVILGDGAVWIWNLAYQHFPAATQIVDLYHAREHVHDLATLAIRLLRDSQPDWLTQRLEELDNGDIPALLAAGQALKFTGSLARDRDRQLGYFETNAHRMRYAHFRSLGMFVGSGVVEAGCKAIIGQRLKLSGMRWTISGAASIAALRCQEASNRWEEIWQRPHSQTPRAHLTTRAS